MDTDIKDYVDLRDEAAEARVSAYAKESRVHIEANERIFQATHQEMLRVNRSIERRMDNIEQAMIAMKKTVIITGISATLSTVFGVAAFNAALLSNMQASFDSGRGFATSQAEVIRQVREMDHKVDQTARQLEETDRRMREARETDRQEFNRRANETEARLTRIETILMAMEARQRRAAAKK